MDQIPANTASTIGTIGVINLTSIRGPWFQVPANLKDNIKYQYILTKLLLAMSPSQWPQTWLYMK
jgi:hypothetical protein